MYHAPSHSRRTRRRLVWAGLGMFFGPLYLGGVIVIATTVFAQVSVSEKLQVSLVTLTVLGIPLAVLIGWSRRGAALDRRRIAAQEQINQQAAATNLSRLTLAEHLQRLEQLRLAQYALFPLRYRWRRYLWLGLVVGFWLVLVTPITVTLVGVVLGEASWLALRGVAFSSFFYVILALRLSRYVRKNIFAPISKSNQAEYLVPLKHYLRRTIIPILLGQVYGRFGMYSGETLPLHSRFLASSLTGGYSLFRTVGEYGYYYNRTHYAGGSSQVYLEEIYLLGQPPGQQLLMEAFFQTIRTTVTDSGRRVERLQPAFNALVIRTPVQTEFMGEHVIFTRNLFRPALPNFQAATLESMEFTKRFEAYTTSQRELRVVLRTNVMRRLLELVSNEQKCWLEFKGGQVYIGLESPKGIFEPNLERETTLEELQESLQRVRAMTNLSRELAINYRTRYVGGLANSNWTK